MGNEIVDALAAKNLSDPRAIPPATDRSVQAGIASRLAEDAAKRVLSYDTLPLYLESVILAIIQQFFEQDHDFLYIPGDEGHSQVQITTAWNRNTLAKRDKKPLIVCAFQESMADEIVMANRFASRGINEVPQETKALSEMSVFRVSVIHHNRTVTLFLAQNIRSAIAAAMSVVKQVFKLQKVYPPSLRGPGNLAGYDDTYIAFVDLRVATLPEWKQTDDPVFIRKILLRAVANADEALVGGISQDLGEVQLAP